jgi:hypothetical protein
MVPGPDVAVAAGGAVVAVESELPVVAVLSDVFEAVVSGVVGIVVLEDGTVVDVELSVPDPVPVVPLDSGVVTAGT